MTENPNRVTQTWSVDGSYGPVIHLVVSGRDPLPAALWPHLAELNQAVDAFAAHYREALRGDDK